MRVFDAGVAVEIERALDAVGRGQLHREEAPREILERVLGRRRDRGGTPSPRCRGRATADRTWSPCASSLARCATTLGSGRANERFDRVAHRRRREEVGVDIGDVVRRSRAPGRARGRRPAAPLQRGLDRDACGAFIAWRSTSSAASASRATTDLDVDRLGVGHVLDGVESPSASRIRGSSVRNSSWSNRTRTRSTSNAPCTSSLGYDADVDVAVEDRHLAVLEHAVLRFAEVLALLGRQLVEVLEDRLRGMP